MEKYYVIRRDSDGVPLREYERIVDFYDEEGLIVLFSRGVADIFIHNSETKVHIEEANKEDLEGRKP